MVERSLTMLTASKSAAEPEQALAPVPTLSPTAVRAATDPMLSPTTIATPSPTDSVASTERSTSSRPTDEREDVRLAGLFSLDKRALALVDPLMDALQDSSLEPNTLLKFLPRLLDRAREDLNKELNRNVMAKQTLSAHDSPLFSSPFLLANQSGEQTSLMRSVQT